MGLAIEEYSLDDVLRCALDGLFIIDRDRRYVVFSDACGRITGHDPTHVIGSQCQCKGLMDCHDRHGRSLAGALCPSLKMFHGELDAFVGRMSVRHHDGRLVWIDTSYSSIKDERGAVRGVIGIMRDVTEMKEREDELRAAAKQDRKTAADPFDCDAREMAIDFVGSIIRPSSGSLDQIVSVVERREILAALHRADGQRTKAARMLGISRSRLYRRMEALKIDPKDIDPGKGA